eukprot:SAG11_NODE_1221_length_5486_cov_7.177650_9_plen_129_part_00
MISPLFISLRSSKDEHLQTPNLLLCSYDTGVVSGAMLLIRADMGLTAAQQEDVVSVTLVGCIIAAMSASVLTEQLGRQPTILLGSLIFCGGAVLMGVAWKYHILLIGVKRSCTDRGLLWAGHFPHFGT